MNENEIEVISTGLDQPLPIGDHIKEELSKVDDVMAEVAASGDLGKGFEFGRGLIVGVQAKGIAMAKLLHRMKETWGTFGASKEDRFEDRVFVEWGISKQTTDKYTTMWKSLFENPDIPVDVRDSLYERPIKTLLKLGRAAREDVFNDDEWRNVVTLPDYHQINEEIQKKLGEPVVGKKALKIFLYDNGTLVATEGDERVTLGALRISEQDMNNKIRWRAIERLKRAAGVLEI